VRLIETVRSSAALRNSTRNTNQLPAYLGAVVEMTVSDARAEHVHPVDGLKRQVDSQTQDTPNSTQQSATSTSVQSARLQSSLPTAVVPVQLPASTTLNIVII